MTTAYYREHQRTGYIFVDVGRYDADVVEGFRRLRGQWDPQSRTWAFRSFEFTDVHSVLARCGYELLQGSRPQARGRAHGGSRPHTSTATQRDPHAWIAEAFAAIRPEHHAKVYRALATALHPDTGGDLRTMQALASTYDTVRNSTAA